MKDIQEITSRIENVDQPLDDVATSGQPEEEHLKRLAEVGYKTVVDLRTPEEYPPPDEWGMAVRRSGLEYLNIPVGHDDIDDETFDRFRQLMQNPERRPALVHCASANRVGALLIPYLILDEGRSPQKSNEIAAGVGLRSDRLERAAFRYVSAKQKDLFREKEFGMEVMEKETIPTVLDENQLDELMRERHDLRLLDVRTPSEYESAHISGSYNVPLDTLGEHATEIREEVDAPVVLVCQSGSRSRQAEKALKRVGMPQLHVLDGGLNGWIAAGKPVRRDRERISLERQVRIAAGALAASGGLLAVKVHPGFGLLSAFVGGGLVFAGVTDTCGMARLLAKLPYNQAGCDVDAMLEALKEGEPPVSI